jgi:hypothetical protein
MIQNLQRLHPSNTPVEVFRYSEISTQIKVVIHYMFKYILTTFFKNRTSSPKENFDLYGRETRLLWAGGWVFDSRRDIEVQTSETAYRPSYQIELAARLKRPQHEATCENIYTASK